jgi:CheY-like chemotaxis protein
MLAQAMLENWGHEVLTASTGAEGIATAVAARPHAALLDVGLPDTSGYEVARRIRAELRDACPLLVAVTGFGQPEDRARSREAGFDAHLVKPPRPEALRDVLARARPEP